MSGKKASKPPEDVVDFFDMPQGSPEWFNIRMGIPTSSKFSCLLAEGKDGDQSETRESYLKKLGGEILTGLVAEDFRNEEMKRGIRMEPLALEWYERAHFVDLERVGFARRTVYPPLGEPFIVGGSPDAWLPKERRVIEVKTVRPDKLFDMTERGAAGYPPKHRAQCQGNMWITGAETCDLVMFYENWRSPLKYRVERDDKYIATLAEQAERFVYELRARVAAVKSKGKGW